jgi:NAD(P)H dehydrogenase (quinone)
MPSILVLYYSRHGSTKKMAYKIADGIESQGCEALIRTVAPVSDNLSTINSSVPDSGDPYVQLSDLGNVDGLALGSPTRFGNMAAAMKYFLDSTSTEWLNGKLIGKPACVFTSSSSMHGGQESTLLSMMLPLFHHGMLITGLPYSEPDLSQTTTGGTPYGASHVATTQNNHALSDEELRLCFAQGKNLATLVNKLES